MKTMAFVDTAGRPWKLESIIVHDAGKYEEVVALYRWHWQGDHWVHVRNATDDDLKAIAKYKPMPPFELALYNELHMRLFSKGEST